MKYETPVDALKAAIEISGGQSALASKLPPDKNGRPISQARVWNWVNRGQQTPAENCPDIEALTGVSCESLRPDVRWSVVRKQILKKSSRCGKQGQDI